MLVIPTQHEGHLYDTPETALATSAAPSATR
jgi:hypothetical protein